jgi:S-adenosylmethionine synthetase
LVQANRFLRRTKLQRLVTSESVTEGHPDKLADRISDAVLDAILAKDAEARVACETLVTTGLVMVAGEITTDSYVDIPRLVRRTVLEVGYTRAKYGFDGDTCAVLTAIDEQSPDIAGGVNESWEWRVLGSRDKYDQIGAGDQGLMFGYATDETPELMPLPIWLAHRLTRRLAEARKTGEIPYLRPDGKAQVTVVYEGQKPLYVRTALVSAQHSEEVEAEQIHHDIRTKVIEKAIPEQYLSKETQYLVNPSGKFVIGGPHGDTGLTGRKIIVDTYGGAVPHGGGAFSGKDPTKVDRSAAYYARYIAKNIVAAGLARRALIELAYAIGKARPVGMRVETFGTGIVPDEKITEVAQKVFDARPRAIIESLDLRRPIYTPTSAYGHFGREGFPWENTDKVEVLRKLLL